jgi:hypothetical protein
MTFDEWWVAMKPAEVDDLKEQFMNCWANAEMSDAEANEIIAAGAFKAGKLEAAEHILELYELKPWVFARELAAYVESLK